MTQVKCRANGIKGLTPAAWKYMMKVQVCREMRNKTVERRAAREEAEKKNITLPKLKWMDGK